MKKIENNISKERFIENCRASQANHISNASEKELDDFYEEFIKLVKFLKEKNKL